MSKTSITDYVIAGIIGSMIISCIIWAYALVGSNHDVSDIDSGGLVVYGNFTQMISVANASSSGVYELNADSGLFDVIGGLIVKGLAVVKTFISGIKFMTINIINLLGFKYFYVPLPIILSVSAIITLLIASVILFRHISGKEDEK